MYQIYGLRKGEKVGDIQNGKKRDSVDFVYQKTPLVNTRYEGNPWEDSTCVSVSTYR